MALPDEVPSMTMGSVSTCARHACPPQARVITHRALAAAAAAFSSAR